jgi:hypothetical protein
MKQISLVILIFGGLSACSSASHETQVSDFEFTRLKTVAAKAETMTKSQPAVLGQIEQTNSEMEAVLERLSAGAADAEAAALRCERIHP